MTPTARSFAPVICALAIAARPGTPAFPQHAVPPSPTSVPVLLVHSASGPYRLVERSDWSRYDDGKYSGHVYREVRANISPIEDSIGGTLYRGNFFVLEETLRDLSKSAGSVDNAVPAIFRVAPNGTLDLREDRGFPSLRGFPAFPAEAVAAGAKWTARGQRAVDPRNDASVVLLPLIVEYQYRGLEPYKGETVHRVFARFATRYKAPVPASPDPAARMRSAVGRKGGAPFVEASGTHEADILIRASDGLPLMIRDRLDETFKWSDGSTIRFRGFTLTFAEGNSSLNRSAAIADLRHAFDGGVLDRDAAGTPSAEPGVAGTVPAEPEAASSALDDPVVAAIETASGIDVEPTEEGVKLTVRDVRFVPDSDEILPAERDRLDLIAFALGKAGDRTFLVEGHTADVGKPTGQLELSKLRAKRIVDELAARGIPAERFLYKGWGGTKPLDSNALEAGRARNRRVEITILE